MMSELGDGKKQVPVPKHTDSGSSSTDSRDIEEFYGDSGDNHVFSDPVVAEYWREVYERNGYENRHRFDPNYKWTAEEEKRLVRRVSEDNS